MLQLINEAKLHLSEALQLNTTVSEEILVIWSLSLANTFTFVNLIKGIIPSE
ncbi:1727_t:CDS:1, partial [Funneliformis geosporum]